MFKMEIFTNPNYEIQLENESIEEKIIKIKKELNKEITKVLTVEEIADKLYIYQAAYEKIICYVTQKWEILNLGFLQVEKNKILYIESINWLLNNFPQHKIKHLWSFILLKAIEQTKDNIIRLDPLNDVIWFYQKTLERFKEKWIIKDFKIIWHKRNKIIWHKIQIIKK